MFLKIFQVSTDEEIVNKVNLSSFSTRNLFQIRACVICARKAKHLDLTTMFTYSHTNTPLDQSERAYYLSYFIKVLTIVPAFLWFCYTRCQQATAVLLYRVFKGINVASGSCLHLAAFFGQWFIPFAPCPYITGVPINAFAFLCKKNCIKNQT